jgi:hypothetical protein
MHSADLRKPGRWFGYYGHESNIPKFCASKSFVTKYAENNQYEYYKILRNIPMLSLPYISLYMYSEEELIQAVELATSLVQYVTEYKDKSDVVRKIGLQPIIQDILGVLFAAGEEDSIPDGKLSTAYQALTDLRDQVGSPGVRNPDHNFAALVCELGFLGWVRYGNSDMNTPADEIYVCNIHDIERFKYMEKNDSCNLGSCT